jgi:hypothetical protein
MATRLAALCFLSSVAWAASVAAQDSFCGTLVVQPRWSDLKARFVYEGLPPPLDDSLIVNDKDAGIANIVVWLHRAPTDSAPAVHPDYAKSARDEVPLRIERGSIIPRVVVVRNTQKLVVSNADPVAHSVMVDFYNNNPFNVLIRPGARFAAAISKPETSPLRLSDSIHPSLRGYLLVRDNPYASVSDNGGNLKIEKLPPGQWTFVVWHERSGFIKEAKRGDKQVEWKRGRITLEIQPGDNDLGEIKLPAALFK